MSRGRQKVSFEGLLQENVLGTFKVIRGFADLQDLAEVSVAMPYQGAGNGPGTGYQRQCDEQHIEDLMRFLSKGRYRFFPEIVLSLLSKGADDPVVTYTKRRASQGDKAYKISVTLKGTTRGWLHAYSQDRRQPPIGGSPTPARGSTALCRLQELQ